MKFSLTFTQDQITPVKKQALEKIAASVTLKGFRPGKAPLDMVEQSVSQEKIIEEAINLIVPDAYSTYIKDHQLKPITQPRIALKKMVTDGDWEFEVEIAEKPEVKLNNYKDAIKGELAKSSIWTPDKEIQTKTDDPKQKQDEESKRITMVFDTLLKTAEVEISELLIDEEVNRSLSRLLEQINKLGLTIDQYLASIGKKPEELRKEYSQTATDNLKLEFILDAVASDEKIQATDKEVEEILQTIKDPKVLESVKNNPVEMAGIKYNIVKHKVVDFLMSL